ncbi:hypothetical protein [Thioalkalivibrio sp. ALJ9]|uniref:hypothetical protein n=1 Tax=Thioalkalivibrio sp. ALJ9 TaxID=1158758 RepID=UPI00039F522B|nr:hypothetical protein [Thioalkalivibrio sp. ALJ9]
MISSTDPWAQYRAIESPPEHIDGRAQLAGYVLFPIPATATGQVAHGAIVARTIERILQQYGHRFTVEHTHLLTCLCDEIRQLHEHYVAHDPHRPYYGLGTSGNIFSALHDHDAQHRDVDALRCWLLTALYTYGASPEQRGVPQFIKRLAAHISATKESTSTTRQLHAALAAHGAIPRADANILADTLNFQKNPARTLALQSLEAIPSRTPIEPQALRSIEAVQTPDHARQDQPNDLAHPAERLEDNILQELPAPDSRLRFGAHLIPDTDASLSAEEARLLYHALTQGLKRRLHTREGVIDFVLALILTTSRCASTVIGALKAFHADPLDGTPAPGTTLKLTDTYWESLRDSEVVYPTVESVVEWQADHYPNLRLPYPSDISRLFSLFLKSDYDLDKISKPALESRIREHSSTVARISQVRIRRTLPVLLYQACGHPRTSQLVAGTNGFISAAPLSYYAPLHETIVKQYAAALDFADITVRTNVNYAAFRTGAPRAAINIDFLRDRLHQTQKRVQESRPKRRTLASAITWLTELMRHTALMFAAATAHRVGFGLSQFRISHIVAYSDQSPGIAYIADKRTKGDDRIAVLPRPVLHQIDHLVSLLGWIRDELRIFGTEREKQAAHFIDQSLSGKSPLFFSLDPNDLSPRLLRAGDLEQHTQIPIEIGRLRHLFATRMEELDAPPCDIQQHMGHRHLGEPYDVIDPDAPYSFAVRFAPFIERYLTDLRLEVVSTSHKLEETRSTCDNLTVRAFFQTSNLGRSGSASPGPKADDDDDDDDDDDENNFPISNIQPDHLRAYRITRALEMVLIGLLESSDPEQLESPQAQQAAVLLCVIWGLTTDPEMLSRLLDEGHLRRIPGAPHVAALMLPRLDATQGVQLLSAKQATVFRLAQTGDHRHLASDTGLKALLSHAPAREILGRGVRLKQICWTASMARRLTAPGNRAAWERGALKVTGPRSDRLLAMITGLRVTPPVEPDLPTAGRTPSRVRTGAGPFDDFVSMRIAIRRWRDDQVPHRVQAVIKAADQLTSISPAGSIPLLLARAIRHHMTTAKRARKIRASTTYQYVTQLSNAVELAFVSDPSEDPRDSTELILTHVCSDLRKMKPVAWVLRHNRDHPEDIPREVQALLADAGELGITNARAGDPITGPESERILEFLTPAPSLQLPERMNPAPRVIHYAATLQATYMLRTGELTTLTTDAHLITPHRSCLWVHPRRHQKLKSVASKRLVTNSLDIEKRREMDDLYTRMTGPEAEPSAARDLLPIPQNRTPLDWQRHYHSTFSHVGAQLFESDGPPPFRCHSYRHSYATHAGYAILPSHFPGLELHLPRDSSPTATVSRLSLRAQYRYISRQLGHGHPCTTLEHYDHSIPLMTDVSHGWSEPSNRLLAALVGRSPGALSQAMLRKRRAKQPEHAAVIGALRLDSLESDWTVREYPEEPNGPIQATTDYYPPSPMGNSARHRLMQFLYTAISLREGRSDVEIASAQDRTVGQVSADRSTLHSIDQTLRLNVLSGSVPERRKSRTESLITIFPDLCQLPRDKLASLSLELMTSKPDADQIVRRFLPQTSMIPKIGQVRRNLLILATQSYLTTTP